MSLDTLLEAAKYLESSSRLTSKDDSAIARVHHSPSVHTERRRAISECEAFERRRRPGGAGTRETHNKLEKNRRAHLKECFDILKREVPSLEDKKTSNLNILRSALKHIQALKKRERDFEAERDLLKINNNTIKQRLLVLRKEITIQLEIAQKSAQNGVIPRTCQVVSEASSTKTSVNLKSSEIQCSPISVATQTSFTSGEESDVDCSSVNAIKMEGGQVNALCNGTVNVGHESKDKVAIDDEDEDVDVEGEITDDNTEDVDALIKDERVKNAKMVSPAEPVLPSGSRPKRKAGAGNDGNKLEAKKSNIQCCARVSC